LSHVGTQQGAGRRGICCDEFEEALIFLIRATVGGMNFPETDAIDFRDLSSFPEAASHGFTGIAKSGVEHPDNLESNIAADLRKSTR